MTLNSPFLCVSKGKQRSDRPEPSPFYVHCTTSICSIIRQTSFYSGKRELSKIVKRKSYRRNTITTKLIGRSFNFAGEGEGSGSLCRVRIFISNLVRATIFIFIQFQHRPFILRYSLFESDGCRIIYFPRDPGQNIYFKVFDGQDIYLKIASPSPPQSESTVRPITKKDHFQPFPSSTDT